MTKKTTYFLSILTIVIFLIIAYASSEESEDSMVDLNASVSFNGTQFVIRNNDTFDYNNVTLEVNGNYKLKDINLKAGETYTVGIMQFADKNGNRFTLMQKPQKFYIFCDLLEGNNGYYFAEW